MRYHMTERQRYLAEFSEAHMKFPGREEPVRPPNLNDRVCVRFDKIVHETGKAYKFLIHNKHMWVPEAACTILSGGYGQPLVVDMPHDMFVKKCYELGVPVKKYVAQCVNRRTGPTQPPSKAPTRTEKSKVTKENCTMKTAMLVTLLTEGFTLVGVKFRNEHGKAAGKTYTYKYQGEISEGDLVVVDSPYSGMVVAQVVEVDDDPVLDIDVGYSYKWIVQKVDTGPYYAHKDRELGFAKHIKRLRNKAFAESALNEIRESLAGSRQEKEFDELIDGLRGSEVKPSQGTDTGRWDVYTEMYRGVLVRYTRGGNKVTTEFGEPVTVVLKGFPTLERAREVARQKIDVGLV